MLSAPSPSAGDRRYRLAPPPEILRAAMLGFVSDRGGCVRYDEFAEEHLHGKTYGFYSQQVDLRTPDRCDVPTASETEPAYREALSGLIGAFFRQAAAHTRSNPAVLVEVGGGAGALKRCLLQQLLESGIPFEYVSVEPNPQHREAQQMPGTRVLEGTAQRLPLQNCSVDLLFDEEVLDCFPMRVLKWDIEGKRITQELFVSRAGEQLRLAWRERDRGDARLDHCEFDLARARYDQPYYHYTPGYWDYLRESARVLRPGGGRFSSDYGYVDPTKRVIPETDLGHIERAVERPYQVDLTHFVDFAYLSKLALIQRSFAKTGLLSLMDVFAEDSEKACFAAMSRFAFVAVKGG